MNVKSLLRTLWWTSGQLWMLIVGGGWVGVLLAGILSLTGAYEVPKLLAPDEALSARFLGQATIVSIFFASALMFERPLPKYLR